MSSAKKPASRKPVRSPLGRQRGKSRKPPIGRPLGIHPRSRIATGRPEEASVRSMAVRLARAADEKLGEDTLLLDLRGLTFITDYIVISTASSPPHAKAIAEAAEKAIEECGGALHHREGDHQSPWLLLDCHDVIVHVFSAQARANYNLEQLWVDAPRVKWKAGARMPRGRLK